MFLRRLLLAGLSLTVLGGMLVFLLREPSELRETRPAHLERGAESAGGSGAEAGLQRLGLTPGERATTEPERAEPELAGVGDAPGSAAEPGEPERTLRDVPDQERRDVLSQSVDELRALAIAADAAASDRVLALQGLAGRKDEEGRDGRNQLVIESVLDLARSSEDSWVRSQVYRNLRGLREPWLVQELAHPLTQDADERVRVASLETLASWLPNAEVELVLRDALRVETSPSIQRRIQALLAGLEGEEN